MILQNQDIADSVQTANDVRDVALQGLYEPPPIPFAFETVGWSILAVLIVMMLLILIFFQIRKYVRNRYRREAIKEMEALQEAPLLSSFLIIKRVAIQVFGREEVATLHGREWLEFLEKSAKGVELLRYEEGIYDVLYADQSMTDATQQDIMSNVKKWIRTHAR
ncbi:DUF4381 domain-containing protein [Reichenbachiella sp. MSK19-1]|uniref:DUF4381 domain-containing protein n=1 Tax=Reichenbachiella sp. MSK19-1 TaxID=1897631 RepID=UPI000E6C55CD|nr:DUF4381 domain-containing protein [Reichenbachiella sp. MSK19-1]RJE72809.1 hypothetical protein BGP76_02330 [Reichenbachiella sp. MSK19-1]